MRRIHGPETFSSDDGEPAYTSFNWRPHEIEYDEVPQVHGEKTRSARGFLVEDDAWFDYDPIRDHVRWWDRVISNHYDRHWEDWEPNQIIFWCVALNGTVVIEIPTYNEATAETKLRFTHMMQDFGVPPGADVHWAIGNSGILKSKAVDYYEGVI